MVVLTLLVSFRELSHIVTVCLIKSNLLLFFQIRRQIAYKMKVFKEMNLVSFEKVRNCFEDFRNNNKTGIRIVVTDYEKKVGELASPSSITTLLKSYPELQKINADFTEFSCVVKRDLEDKTVVLMNLKEDKWSTRSDKSYARIQLFMMNQYIKRLSRFDFLHQQSLLKMSKRYLRGEDLTDMVRVHGNIVTKMLRRMKMMMDVTEKYVDSEAMDAVHQMKTFCQNLDSRYLSASKFSSSLHSLDGLPEVNKDFAEFTLSWRSKSLSDFMSPDLDQKGKRKRDTFRSVTDHFSIISKSINVN